MLQSSKEKYQINLVDADIMTKFISTKKLMQFFDDYHVENLSIDFEQKYITDIFHNLVESIINLDIHFKSSIWHTLVNLAVLINHIDLDISSKRLLEESIVRLFENEKFHEYFFSVHSPDSNVSLKVFVDLCENVISTSNYNIISAVLKSKHFFEYENNTSLYSIRAFLKSFIKDEGEKAARNIKSIIDNFENVNQKITCVGLLFRSLPQGEIKEEIKEYIETHFASVENKYLLDFVFGDLIDCSKEKINSIVDEIIAIDDKQSKTAVKSFPDPLESKLEILYLLILTDKISDTAELKRLENLNTKTSFIDFILHPDTFDFNCVDFSNYMWVNFARQSKYMDKFIKAKEILIPKIQQRVKIGDASEDEKKILYGFLLDKETIWKR